MKTPKRRDDVLRALCAQPTDEDGLNPKLEKKQPPRRGISRKDLQLCKRVCHALARALSADVTDRRLRDIEVVAVDPDPDATRLRVSVRPCPGAAFDTTDALAALRRAKGFLRSCIGNSTSRKRVPELTFAPAPLSTPGNTKTLP
ncbi:MAG TPA: ribosome-binding factor A [Phycisphaerales bacterium]|nr:ribosome-binding factor A [Phycisphaerales bacterium]